MVPGGTPRRILRSTGYQEGDRAVPVPIHCRVSTPYSPRSTALWFNFSFEYHRYPLSHPGLVKSGAGDRIAAATRWAGTLAGR